MPSKIDVKTLALLNRLLGDFGPVTPPLEPLGNSHENARRLNLPSAPGAEYFFKVWFYEDGERQISAHLILHSSEDNYFWHRPFELAEFRGSQDDLVTEFCKELEALLTHETRIVQRKGWLSWHFSCEYRAGEKWKSVCSHSAFRGVGFKPPQIEGSKRVYHSAPIANVAAAD
jgi:hypothetical protein